MTRIILIALAVFIYSCSGNIGTKQIDFTVKTTKIRLVSKPDSIITKISEIASDIEYIPLHTSVNTGIRAIDKIITRGNKIYINLIDNILCFDNRGHFLYKLYGNANDRKENVVAIYDFDIDTIDTTLIVLYGNKILQFKNTDAGFAYIKTINLGRISPSKLNFVPRTANILLSSFRLKGYEPSLNVVVKINGDSVSNKRNYFKRFNPVKNAIWDNIVHYQFENNLNFKDRFNDTVFSISSQSNNFEPALIFDSRLSSTNAKNINDPYYFKMLPSVVNIFEVPRYIYYEYYLVKIQDHKVFYDKYYDRKYEIDPEKGALKDDIGGGPDFYPKYFSEGKMYSWISAKDLKIYIKSNDFDKAQVQNPIKHEQLRKLVSYLKENDNPILILVKLKN